MTEMTREETLLDLQKFLNERVPALEQAHAAERARQQLHGSRYVVYTGDDDCPVWVDYTEDEQGCAKVGPAFGVLNVRKFDSRAVATRLASVTTNGKGDCGKVREYMSALELEMEGLKRFAQSLKLTYPA